MNVSSTATGASFTGSTVNFTTAVSVEPSSFTISYVNSSGPL